MRVLRLIPLILLVGCTSHINGCEGSDASRYAHFLAPDAYCANIKYGDVGEYDYSICTVSQTERWLCQGDGHCWPLGPAIQIQRK